MYPIEQRPVESPIHKDENLLFFKKNVPYTIGIRFHMRDNVGKMLTEVDPYVAVPESILRDFKRANAYHFKHGLLVSTEEPLWDADSPNDIDDDKAVEIVKNVFTLKKVLKEVDSPPIVAKLLETAKELSRPQKTINLIQEKLDEMKEESPFGMGGVTTGSPDDSRI
jgi:hypothetical protein